MLIKCLPVCFAFGCQWHGVIIDLWGRNLIEIKITNQWVGQTLQSNKTNLSRLRGGRHKVNANVYNMLTSADKSRSVISPCCSNSESIAFAVCTGPCTFCYITELNQCKANHFSPTAANTTVFWHVGTQTHEKKHFVNSKNTDEPCVYMQVPQQNNSVCH